MALSARLEVAASANIIDAPKSVFSAHPLEKTIDGQGNCRYRITYSLPDESYILAELAKSNIVENKGSGIAWFLADKSLPTLADFVAKDAEDKRGDLDGISIHNCCGYTLLGRNFIELLKNSITAQAKHFQCEFMLDKAENKVHIFVRDDQTNIVIDNVETTRLRQKKRFASEFAQAGQVTIGIRKYSNDSPVVQSIPLNFSPPSRDGVAPASSSMPSKESISGSNAGLLELSQSCIRYKCELALTSDVDKDGEKATFHFISPLTENKKYDAFDRPKFNSGKTMTLSTANIQLRFSTLLISPSTGDSIAALSTKSTRVRPVEESPEPPIVYSELESSSTPPSSSPPPFSSPNPSAEATVFSPTP
jgi:hypothetical protein